uniref:CWH43-like N-terminal domain-containing protein n=3 Tax=Xenopus tropicalis TaxID=8364 RepID=A0A1B8Y7V6_XENTR|eukprot:XP_017945047.1 PREDICTED: DNA damage-regulated autophagy modulator protein 1-like isoform X1 [Xenopus tropicalis]
MRSFFALCIIFFNLICFVSCFDLKMKISAVTIMALAPFFIISVSFIGLLIYNMAAFFSGLAPYTSGLRDFALANIAFTVLHGICCYIGAATMYARYTLLRHRSAESGKKRTWANVALLLLGLLACQAYFLENFPVLAFQSAHIAGVLTATVCASAYTIINTVISYRTPPEKDGRVKCLLRLIISVTTVFFLVIGAAFAFMFIWMAPVNTQLYEIMNILRVTSEWLSTVTFYGYLATFATDFKIYGFTIPKNMKDDWFYVRTKLPGDVEANEESEI